MIEVRVATRSALVLAWATARCLPERHNGDPTKKLHLHRCSWTAASSVQQHKPSWSRRASNVKTTFQLMSWRESHLLRTAGLTLSTLARNACCNPSNFFGPFVRLRWLRVLEGKLCINLNNFNYKPQAENHQLHLGVYIERHP